MKTEPHKWRKHPELINYRDYIKSEFWTERKRLYFSTHPHKCEVCGHPDVDLHHLRYGSYGQEQDKYLAALCRAHHKELHNAVALRKNMFYQSNSVIENMRTTWEEFRNGPVQTVPTSQAGSPFSDFMERLARPLWRMIGRVW